MTLKPGVRSLEALGGAEPIYFLTVIVLFTVFTPALSDVTWNVAFTSPGFFGFTLTPTALVVPP